MKYYSMADISESYYVEFGRGRDKKKRDPRDDKGKKRFLGHLALATGASALLSAPFLLADRAVAKKESSGGTANTYTPLNDEQKSVLKGLGVDLRTPQQIKDEEEAAKRAYQEWVDSDRAKNIAYQNSKKAPAYSRPLYLDDPEIDKKYGSKPRLAAQKQALSKVKRGSEGMDLATDIAALNNRTVRSQLSNAERRTLVQKVAGRLAFLRDTNPVVAAKQRRLARRGAKTKRGSLKLIGVKRSSVLGNKGNLSRLTTRKLNFQKIVKGSEGRELATDLAALRNKGLISRMPKQQRKELIQKVGSALRGLKQLGKFSTDYYHLADFSRRPGSKDKTPRRKKPQMLGERLTTKVRQYALPSTAIGGVAGLAMSGGNLRYAARSALSGGAIGAGIGATTWGLGARSPIPGIRNWQRRRNK